MATKTTTTIEWKKRGVGYYEATGFSGIALAAVREDKATDAFAWSLYAGDSTTPRVRAATFGRVKQRADAMFG